MNKKLPPERTHNKIRMVSLMTKENCEIVSSKGAVWLVFMVLIFFLQSCSTYHYYIVQSERIDIDKGFLTFGTDTIDDLIESSKNPKIYNDPKFENWSRSIERYRPFQADSSMTYMSLNVYYALNRGFIPPVILSADSVKIQYGSLTSAKQIDIFELKNEIGDDGRSIVYKYIKIEPIPIPKTYVDSFEMEFDLSILNESDSTLIERRPIKLRFDHRTKKYSFLNGV